MENRAPLSQVLVLGTLEVLLNQALALHPQGQQTLASLAGQTIRVRAYEPDFIFYCFIDEQGVELSTEFDGDANIRVRGSAAHLLHRSLIAVGDSAGSEPADDIQIDGETESVAALRSALETFNLREALRTWLREHVAMPELLGILRQHDPAWMERLQDLPQLVAELLADSRRQSAMQQQLLDEVRQLKESLHSERRTDILCITTGIALLALALLGLGGSLPVTEIVTSNANTESLVLAALGIALMLSRLFGKRYRS